MKMYYGAPHDAATLAAHIDILPSDYSVVATVTPDAVIFNAVQSCVSVLTNGRVTGYQHVEVDAQDVFDIAFLNPSRYALLTREKFEEDVELWVVAIEGQRYAIKPCVEKHEVVYEGEHILPLTLGRTIETYTLDLVTVPDVCDSSFLEACLTADEGHVDIYATFNGFAVSVNHNQFFAEFNFANSPEKLRETVRFNYEALSLNDLGLTEERRGLQYEAQLLSGTHFRNDVDGSVALPIDRHSVDMLMQPTEAKDFYTVANLAALNVNTQNDFFAVAQATNSHPDCVGSRVAANRSEMQQLNSDLALLWHYCWESDGERVAQKVVACSLLKHTPTVEV